MILGLLLLIIGFSFVLIKSADIAVISLRRLATGGKLFGISAIIIALGTSFPELFVGVTSALEKDSNLSLGVIIGSNIANIALIAALASIAAGKVIIHGDYLRKNVWIALFAGCFPLILAADGSLNRIDGLILLCLYLAYATGFFKSEFERIAKELEEGSFFHRFFRRFNHHDGEKTKDYGKLFVSVSLMLFSADIVVRFSKMLAEYANIPLFLVGLFILAIGTSLPELAFSLESIKEHEPSMFFGNILGSIIANSTLVVGLVSVINPIKIVAFSEYSVSAVTFVIVFLVFYFFIKTKNRLDRWEAAMLLVLYISFAILEFS
jgi:cation:H+ antiporter